MSESVCLQMSLSEKSDEELGSLLSQYGIKHGPIVGKYTQGSQFCAVKCFPHTQIIHVSAVLHLKHEENVAGNFLHTGSL